MREEEPMKLNNYPRLGNNLPPEGTPLGTLLVQPEDSRSEEQLQDTCWASSLLQRSVYLTDSSRTYCMASTSG